MERWLLVSNCQTFGLANSFALLNGSLQVEAVDAWTFKADPARYNDRMAQVDRVIVHPDIARDPEFDTSRPRILHHLPSIDFGAYHPDFGYFISGETFIEGPAAAYQSVIAIAAYNEGLSLADTRRLFTGRIYEDCGYHHDWVPQRDALIERYRSHGVEISGSFPHWGRGRAFMYSVNHPRIEQVHDVAKAFVRALGMPVVESDILPPDNLVAGPCLPVYPEVAEMLGVRGSDLFKPSGTYGYINLDEFLRGSFDVFAGYDRHAIQPYATYRPRYDHVLSVIRGAA